MRSEETSAFSTVPISPSSMTTSLDSTPAERSDWTESVVKLSTLKPERAVFASSRTTRISPPPSPAATSSAKAVACAGKTGSKPTASTADTARFTTPLARFANDNLMRVLLFTHLSCLARAGPAPKRRSPPDLAHCRKNRLYGSRALTVALSLKTCCRSAAGMSSPAPSQPQRERSRRRG